MWDDTIRDTELLNSLWFRDSAVEMAFPRPISGHCVSLPLLASAARETGQQVFFPLHWNIERLGDQ